jgi:hypothetical protein
MLTCGTYQQTVYCRLSNHETNNKPYCYHCKTYSIFSLEGTDTIEVVSQLLIMVIPSCSEIWVQRGLSDYPMGNELWLPLIIESWRLLLLFVGSLGLFIALTEWLIQAEKFVKNLHANTEMTCCDLGRAVGWCIGGSNSKTERIQFLYTAEI